MGASVGKGNGDGARNRLFRSDSRHVVACGGRETAFCRISVPCHTRMPGLATLLRRRTLAAAGKPPFAVSLCLAVPVGLATLLRRRMLSPAAAGKLPFAVSLCHSCICLPGNYALSVRRRLSCAPFASAACFVCRASDVLLCTALGYPGGGCSAFPYRMRVTR